MAKGFCILRVNKIKTAGGVSGMALHNSRERPVENADKAKLNLNSQLDKRSAAAVMALWRDRCALDKKPRKNAVVALDYMIHASPNALTPKERDTYLTAAYDWLVKRHGKENIIQASIHRDERTEPHIHVLVVPLCKNKKQEWKLNASHWTDGRRKLSAMQTEFAQEVGSRFDLARGIEGSKAKHQAVQRLYALASREYTPPTIEVSKPPRLGDLDEWRKQEAARLSRALAQQFQRAEVQANYAVAVRKTNGEMEYYKDSMKGARVDLAVAEKKTKTMLKNFEKMSPEDFKKWKIDRELALQKSLDMGKEGW